MAGKYLLINQRDAADENTLTRVVNAPENWGVLLYDADADAPAFFVLGTGFALQGEQLVVTIPKGDPGVSPKITIGTVTAGDSPSASISGDFPELKLNLVLQRGQIGATPQLKAKVTTLAAGAAATVAISGTAESPVLELGIPQGAAGRSYAPQGPVLGATAVNTASRPTDTTKPYRVYANARSAITTTLASLAAGDKIELRIAPTAAGALANGAGGFSLGVWESGISGIALAVGMGIQDGGQLSADVPAGWYYSINRLSGTNATLVSCFTQFMAA